MVILNFTYRFLSDDMCKAGVAKTQILSRETVCSLFNATTLTEKGVRSLNTMVSKNDSQWSTGLCVNTTDWPGMRRKGSGWCKFDRWYSLQETYILQGMDGPAPIISWTQPQGLQPCLGHSLCRCQIQI